MTTSVTTFITTFITNLELVCLALVGVWAVLRFRTEHDRRGLAQQVFFIAAAAWIAEDSCIRLYGFYFYDDERWALLLDRVPLLIILIWPIVVTAALDVARVLAVPRARWPLFLFVLVVADAWFIEPIAVDAGLWRWTQPGLFEVPAIGVLGWGCFAAGIGVVAARGEPGRGWPFVASVVVGPVVCHVLLLALWWGALRWSPTVTGELKPLACAWIVSLALAALIVKRRPPGLRDLVWLRAPAALFFFGLLFQHADLSALGLGGSAGTGGDDAADDDLGLLAWSLAFAPPWFALWLFSRRASSSSSSASSPLSP